MLGGVLRGEVAASRSVDLASHGAQLGFGEGRLVCREEVVDYSVVVDLHVVDCDRAPREGDLPVVGELSPRFRIEERPRQDDRDAVLPA